MCQGAAPGGGLAGALPRRRVLIWLWLFAAGFAALYVSLADYVEIPWVDGVCTADSAINLVTKGEWRSYAWNYTYQPLYGLLLAGWVWLFGVSHAVTCSLGVCLYALSFVYIGAAMSRCGWLSSPRGLCVWVVLFWVVWAPWWVCACRIDSLTLLAASVVVRLLLSGGGGERGTALFLSAVALMLSSLYAVPLVAVFVAFLFAVDYGGVGRMAWLRRGAAVAAGFCVGLALTCLFYFLNDFLLHYLGAPQTAAATSVSWNPFIKMVSLNFGLVLNGEDALLRLVHAYTSEPMAIVLLAVAWGFAMRIGRWRLLLGFVSLIPLLMTLFGRYTFSYSWVFSIPTMVCLVALSAEGGFVRLATPLRVGLCAVLLSVPEGFRYWVNYLKNTPSRWEQNERTGDFVRSQSATLAKFDNIIATDPVAYYPLTALGKRLYMFQYDNIEVPSSVRGCEPLNQWLSAMGYKEYQPDDCLPDSGVLVVTPYDRRRHVAEYRLSQKPFATDTLASDGGFLLVAFKL